MTTTPTGTFPSFPNPPEELRWIIWELSLSDPQIIQLEQYIDPKEPNRRYASSGVKLLSNTHSLLFVNKEARNEALRKYTPYKGYPTGPTIFGNLGVDIFCYPTLTDSTLVFQSANLLYEMKEGEGRGEPGKARKIAHGCVEEIILTISPNPPTPTPTIKFRTPQNFPGTSEVRYLLKVLGDKEAVTFSEIEVKGFEGMEERLGMVIQDKKDYMKRLKEFDLLTAGFIAEWSTVLMGEGWEVPRFRAMEVRRVDDRRGG